MTCLVFQTPGLIDIRAFTTMGLSAKPSSSNPIGMFGTGLKYAAAVAARLGGKFIVFIGKDRYVFEQRPSNFRGKSYNQLRLRRERWSLTRATYTDLPFTTEYGKNWKPWMVFRELEANTRDEGGETFLSYDAIESVVGYEGFTRIVIEHPEVTKAWEEKDEVFLPGALRERSEESLQLLPKPSSTLFWRGLRVYQTNVPCLYTYNFLKTLELTEDRTLTAEFWAKLALAKWLASECKDEAVIKAILTAKEKSWEYDLDFGLANEPSELFLEIMESRRPRSVGARASSYFSRYDRRPPAPESQPEVLHPLPWTLRGEQVFDANDTAVLAMPYNYSGRWEHLAGFVIQTMNRGEEAPQEFEGLPLEVPELQE